jgi:exopolysaccharide production protein ExoZ
MPELTAVAAAARNDLLVDDDRDPATTPLHARADNLDAVQMLRGVAACLVVFYHARFAISGDRFLDAGDRLFVSGASGVDLFFLISGFIMVHATVRSRDPSPGRFLIKRAARIWPPYVIATLISLPLNHEFAWTGDDWLGVVRAFGFLPLAATGAPFYGWTPLGVGWTLCYEAWFYVLFAVALLFGRFRWLALAALFALVLVGVPLALGQRPGVDAYRDLDVGSRVLAIITNPLMLEFAIGCAIGGLYESRLTFGSVFWSRIAVATSATVFVAVFIMGKGNHGPLSWGWTSALVVFAVMIADKSRALRVPRWLVWLGDISFSLYLVHPIVQAAGRTWIPGFRGGAYFIGTTAFSLIVATIAHRYLERGLSEWVRARLLRSNRR